MSLWQHYIRNEKEMIHKCCHYFPVYDSMICFEKGNMRRIDKKTGVLGKEYRMEVRFPKNP
jgi:hypothetical protein